MMLASTSGPEAVVPRAGTWIEIIIGCMMMAPEKSCPVRARGLK